MEIVFFTAGTKGAGHLVRGLAIDRAIRRLGLKAKLTILTPPTPFARIAPEALEVPLDVSALRTPSTAPTTALAQTLARLKPDLLIVDVFWVPLVFVPVACPVWLLLRSVPPPWLVGPAEAPFNPQRYDRILAIEPAPMLAPFEALDPIVMVNPDEVAAPGALRAVLGHGGAVVDDGPLRVVVQAGLPEDTAVLSTAAAALGLGAFSHLDLHASTAPFPVAPLLAQAETVVAAPGYNTFWESRWLGFGPRTHFVPIRRQLDDGAWRAGLDPGVVPIRNGADTLAKSIKG